MISFDEARKTILGCVGPVAAECVALNEALGRVLAEDIVAEADLVPFARSAMDGHALRGADSAGATSEHPLTLPVTGAAFAEAVPGSSFELAAGTAMAISTGAPLPRGADAVVPSEQVESRDGAIVLSAPVCPGDFVFPPGEDVRAGDLLAKGGEAIHPSTLGLLAFVGRAQLRLYRRPRVSVVCTGSELVDVGSTPAPGQVRNSNAYALAGLVRECGAEAATCSTVPDDREAVSRAMETARSAADALVTSGGASVGPRDLVKGVLAELGVEFRFRAVAMRPGKPTGFGTWSRVRGIPVFVLPGNPAAAFVSFQELVRPALLLLAGRSEVGLPAVRARLRGPLHSRPNRRYFAFARLRFGSDGFEVVPLENQCSVLVRTSAEANGLIVVPEEKTDCRDGDSVEVHVLDWGPVVTR